MVSSANVKKSIRGGQPSAVPSNAVGKPTIRGGGGRNMSMIGGMNSSMVNDPQDEKQQKDTGSDGGIPPSN